MDEMKTGAHERRRRWRRLLLYLGLTLVLTALLTGTALFAITHFEIGFGGRGEIPAADPSDAERENDSESAGPSGEASTEASSETDETASESEEETGEPEKSDESGETDESAETAEPDQPNGDEILLAYRAAPGEARHDSVGHSGPYTIVLDPGHGFRDRGCEGLLDGYTEKDITLTVAKKLRTFLENYGFTVYLTHDGETFPDQDTLFSEADACGIAYDTGRCEDNDVYVHYERTVWANVIKEKYGADLLFSLHVNAVENADYVSGMEFDYSTETYWSDVSRAIFRDVTDCLETAFPDTNLKLFEDSWEDSFIMTKYVDMPSMLLEMGYSTNEKDAADLVDEEWQDAMARAIANGIYQYFCGI